ncbi:THUMP domain-containing class I SAM-dependent RNA methyltransferase [Solitalea canadensis]|uniref:Putative N6-adenine-specific DNA methylase n=1 Tax=Solitalea canadensis (strain ATCC 29591 / DSM 3403 / JCM 21819 / LMG 8368 / NBRC 15130 / NCIMB 12057 / USAM 9D) TaxID=929556 RepID=H8KM16_SOLCM|nr:RNA methyltransferase [Solitalea canadensis]AFD08938.1 putative N6-adenine-specific DNA methylase [Solitalea canadensis DSM 3403]
MSVFNTPEKIIVTCPKYISTYLKREMLYLGFEITDQGQTYIETVGTLTDCMKLNLNLRTGNNVLYQLKAFKAMNPDQLYDQLVGMPWEKWIDEAGYLSITCNVSNPFIDNTMFANVRVKDAIVDRLMQKRGRRPDSGPKRDKAVVHLHWKEDRAAIYIDTSGETLSKHGYRKHPGLAPMQENLAAAVIMATGWNGDGNFVNPMCGSGTLAIEAALFALKRSVGLFRDNFGFMHIKDFDEAIYVAERRKARELAQKRINGRIIATDIEPIAIDLARKNAVTAGVDQYIDFQVCDFRETEVPEGDGVVIFNPEYGERLGDFDELVDIYKAIGDFMKKDCQGYKGYIFTGSPNLAKKVGLKATKKIEFYNSKLECRLLEYELYGGSRRTEDERPQKG